MMHQNKPVQKGRIHLIEQAGIPLFISILILLLVIFCSLMQMPKTKYITIGYPIIEGFQEIDEQGNYFGYHYEIIKQIALHNHWNVTFVQGDYQNLMKQVSEGTIDLMGGIHRTAQTQQILSFTNTPAGNDRSVLLSKTIPSALHQYKALQDKRIGFLSNLITYDDFTLLSQNHAISFEPFFFDTYDALMEALNANIIDVVSISSMYKVPAEWIIANYRIADYYFVTAKHRLDLLAELNDGLAYINRSKPSFYDDLYQHYYTDKKTTLLERDSGVAKILLYLLFVMIPFILIYLVYQSMYRNRKAEYLHHSYIKGIKNNEMKVHLTPIASTSNKKIALFALQYYWDSPLLGQMSKEEMMKIRGKKPRFKFRFHELTVICRSISKVIQNPDYQHAQFIIAMSNPYPNQLAVYKFMLLLQYFLRHYHIPSHHLLFSFTNAIVRDEKTKLQMAKIGHRFGLRFVMSDFAFQFSSLSQLKKINYDYFTIDAIYTDDAASNEISYQIMKLIVNIAASLQKKTIAFGIDSEESYRLALEIGCDYIQGTYISKQLELEDLCLK